MIAAAGADAGRVFAALADPTRRAIVERLAEGPLSVSRLAEPLDISLAAVGQHLSVLEQSGLVRTHKQGRVRTCEIDAQGFSVLEFWISQQRRQWRRRLDRLGEVIAED